ncbi:unnamed protein product [Effrenium voratum]|uniref:Uncharacterized protein n=1 Tax=Effrenium voratum TaxID=2562239 RepID=A0AA36HKX8_9DINO|nr:unnamed protein product [Effrenium voratum]
MLTQFPRKYGQQLEIYLQVQPMQQPMQQQPMQQAQPMQHVQPMQQVPPQMQQMQHVQQSQWPPLNIRSDLKVGDVVYRQGQIGSVVAVDHSLSPPSYVVRMAQTGDEVNCELQNLVIPNDLNVPRDTPTPTSFADMVRQQRSQTPHAEVQETPVHEELEDALPQTPQWPEASAEEPQEQGPPAIPWTQPMPSQMPSQQMPAQQMPGQMPAQTTELSEMQYEQLQLQMLQQMQMLNMQQYQLPLGENMQQYQLPLSENVQQYQLPGYDAQPGVSPSGEKNFALQALSEALDRAEVDMLTAHRPRSDDVSEAMRQCGFEEGLSGLDDRSSNYALKAATEALSRLERPKPEPAQELDQGLLAALGLRENPARKSKERRERRDEDLERRREERPARSVSRHRAAEAHRTAEDFGGYYFDGPRDQEPQVSRHRAAEAHRTAEDFGGYNFDGPRDQEPQVSRHRAAEAHRTAEDFGGYNFDGPRDQEPQDFGGHNFDGPRDQEPQGWEDWHPRSELQAKSEALIRQLEEDLALEEAAREEVGTDATAWSMDDLEMHRFHKDAAKVPERPVPAFKAPFDYARMADLEAPMPRRSASREIPEQLSQAEVPRSREKSQEVRQDYLLDFVLHTDRLGPGRATPSARQAATCDKGFPGRRMTPRRHVKTHAQRDQLVDFVLDGPGRSTTPNFVRRSLSRNPSMKGQSMSSYRNFPDRKMSTPRRQGGKVQPTGALPPLGKKQQYLW